MATNRIPIGAVGSINDTSPAVCLYPISTRINGIETLFPCPPFLLFALCFLSRSLWNLKSLTYAPTGVGQMIMMMIITVSIVKYINSIIILTITTYY